MNTLLEEAIESWEDVRRGVIDEAENIPASRFDFRPSPDVRDVSQLVVHIMEVSCMMTGELTREDTRLNRFPWPRLLEHYSQSINGIKEKKPLIAALKSTLRDGVKEFRRVGDIHMLQLIVRFDGKQGTRLQWLHHGISQEMYHRGQLTLYQRLMGIKPALTAKIESASSS